MSRPLLHMHVQRLEAAHLVTGQLEIGADGKAVKYFEVTPFAIHLTPASIAAAAALLSPNAPTRRTLRERDQCQHRGDSLRLRRPC